MATACRNSVRSETRQTLNLMRESLAPVNHSQKLSPGQIASDLRELCAMGLIERVRDEHGVTRYRPTNGRIA